MMNAGNLKGKTRQTSDWRRRMIAFVSALTLLISSCGLTAFAEPDEDIYSDPVTAPIPAANTSPEPEEGEAEATPAPEDQPETGTEPQEATGEGTETEGEPEVSEEPEDLTVYEPGTLTAEADGVGITVDYTAEARVPEGTVLTLTRAAGGDLYIALKSASKVLKTEENATWKRELGEDAVFYAITLTDSEGNEVHPETGVTLTCTNLEIPADATGFVTGDNAENLDWKDTLTVEFLPDAIGYAYLTKTQIGTVTLTHNDRDYMVTAAYGPDAGFPENTELKVREIMPGTPEYALYSGMTEDAVSEEWSEITLQRYFDITFTANGEELEPKANVDVQIIFRDKIEENEDHEVQAVHIENNEATVIEADTESNKTAKHDDEAIDTVTFTADSFSVYGVLQKTVIMTKVLAADGNTYEIEVTYTKEAEIPENAQVKVEEIPEGSDLWEAYRKQTAAALNADDVRLPGLYDISIIDEAGAKVEPKAPVSVSIKLANAENTEEELHVIHFTEEIPQELVEAEAKTEEQTEVQTEEQTAAQSEPLAEEDKIASEKITATVEDNTVTFETQSFSVYAFAYTVDFYYGEYEYHLEGGTFMSLKNLLTILHIVEADQVQEFVNNIAEVTFSNPALLSVSKVEEDTTVGEIIEKLGLEPGYSVFLTEEDIANVNATEVNAIDWALISLQAFDTHESLTVIMNNGDHFTIAVDDGKSDFIVYVNYKDAGYIQAQTDPKKNEFVKYSNKDSYQLIFDEDKDGSGNITYYKHKEGSKNYGVYAIAKAGYEFAFWVIKHSDGSIVKLSGNTLPNNPAPGDICIACFVKSGHKLVVFDQPEPANGVWFWADGMHSAYNKGELYYDDATESKIFHTDYNDNFGDKYKYNFLGWFEGSTLISEGGSFQHEYNATGLDHHMILKAKYELKDQYRTNKFIWLDAGDGVSKNNGDSTMVSRISGNGERQGAGQMMYEKNYGESFILPSADGFGKPLSDTTHKFALEGWYDIKAESGEKKFYRPGESYTVKRDTVLYASWFPSEYNFHNGTSTVSTRDTSSFINMTLYDYNGIYNMRSIKLDDGASYIKSTGHYEQWSLNGNKSGSADVRDFIFLTTDANVGRLINPNGRESDDGNKNREAGADNNHYNAYSAGLAMPTDLTNENTPGVKRVGTANYLFRYDSNSGYYYYDSTKNKAAYGNGRFYVYRGTEKVAGTYGTSDFLPFNNGKAEYNEGQAEPNYWFGMKTEINFYLPNDPGAIINGQTGNRSTTGREMVYKFSGDDDVWVFVDGKLILNMSGIHGLIYGEINFSTGKYTLVTGGRDKTTDSDGIMSYGSSGGSAETHDLTGVGAGDHTIEMVYLERGASQSNCAIYFNLAPRTQKVKLRKVTDGTKYVVQGAEFQIYTKDNYINRENGGEPINSDDYKQEAEMDAYHHGTTFVSDDVGRFFEGELPVGEYYIVETKAPYGLEELPASSATYVKVDANGVTYFDAKENKNKTRPKNGEDYLDVYIYNDIQKGSIKVTKDWDETAADFEQNASAILFTLERIPESQMIGGTTTTFSTDYICENKEVYNLNANNIYDYNGTKYLKINKNNDDTWETVEIKNLYMACISPDKGRYDTYPLVTCYYQVTEAGYLDTSNQFHAIDPQQMTVTYTSEDSDEIDGHTAIKANAEPYLLTITNKSKLTKVEVQKTWAGDPYADSVTVQLYRTVETPPPAEIDTTAVVHLAVTLTDEHSKASAITAHVNGQNISLTKNDNSYTGDVELTKGQNYNVSFTGTASDGYSVVIDNDTIIVGQNEEQNFETVGTVHAPAVQTRNITLTINWTGEGAWTNSSNGESKGFWAQVGNTSWQNWVGFDNYFTQASHSATAHNVGTDARLLQMGSIDYDQYTFSLNPADTYWKNGDQFIVNIPAGTADISYVLTITPKNNSSSAENMRTAIDIKPLRFRAIAGGSTEPASNVTTIALIHPEELAATTVNLPAEHPAIADIEEMEAVSEPVVLTSASGSEAEKSWYHLWRDLPAEDENGYLYHYYVVETIPDNTKQVDYSRTENIAEALTSVGITNTPTDNPQYASFSVNKVVEGTTTDRLFTVRLKREKSSITEWLSRNSTTGVPTWGNESGATEFTFAHGQTLRFTGLDIGYEYTVVEDTGTGKIEVSGYNYDPASVTAASANIVTATAYTGTITNKYKTPVFGSVEVEKVVTNGTESDAEKLFSFQFSVLDSYGDADDSVNGALYGHTFEDGVATFILKAGDKETFSGLPEGLQFSVTETPDALYNVTATLDDVAVELPVTGTIIDSHQIKVKYSNDKKPTVDVESEKSWGTTDYPLSATAIKLKLQRRTEEDGDPEDAPADQIVVTANETWKAKWKELPKFAPDGTTPYIYSVVETGVYFGELEDGKVPASYTWDKDPADYFTAEYTGYNINNTPKLINVVVQKNWFPQIAAELEWYAKFNLVRVDTPNEVIREITINQSSTLEDRTISGLPRYEIVAGEIQQIEYTTVETEYKVYQPDDPDHPLFSYAGGDYTPASENEKYKIGDPNVISDSDGNQTIINTNSKNTNTLTVHKEWKYVINTDDMPGIYFSLYRYREGDNPRNQGTYIERVLAHQLISRETNWNWTLPTGVVLEEIDSATGKKWYYFVDEDRVDDNGNPYVYGDRYIDYHEKSVDYDKTGGDDSMLAHRRVRLVSISSSEGSVTDPNVEKPFPMEAFLTKPQGSFTITNCAPGGYIQMDLKKKYLEYKIDENNVSSLWTTTQMDENKRNRVIEVQLYRRAVENKEVVVGGDFQLATGYSLEVLEGWKKYGYPIKIGYKDTVNDPYLDDGGNTFPIIHAGGDWHWTIGQKDHHTGLPKYGYILKDGNYIAVKYQYVVVETHAYIYDNGNLIDDGEMLAILPGVWQGQGEEYNAQAQQIKIFPSSIAQDQDRLINVPATGLKVKKLWAGMPTAKKIYLKIYRCDKKDYNQANRFDLTNILNTRTYDFDGELFSTDGAIEGTGSLITIDDEKYICLSVDNGWEAEIKHLPTRGTDGTYYYWIKEVGYGNGTNDLNTDLSQFDPVTYSFENGQKYTVADGSPAVVPNVSGATTVLTVTNTSPYGALQIIKEVTNGSEGAAKNTSFTFLVTLKLPEGKSIQKSDLTVDAEEYKDFAFDGVTRTATFKVKIKGTKTINIGKIPLGTEYTVVEQNLPEGWKEVSTVYSDNEETPQTVEATDSTPDTVTVTNTEFTDIKIDKKWFQADGRDITSNIENAAITVQLKDSLNEQILDADGSELEAVDLIITLTSDDEAPKWEHTWSNLRKRYASGTVIEYQVVETSATVNSTSVLSEANKPATTTDGKNFVLQNPLPDKSIEITKEWVDGASNAWPDEIDHVTVGLYRKVESTTSPYLDAAGHQITVDIDSENEQKATIENLPVYDDTGALIEYSIKETSVTPKGSVTPVEVTGDHVTVTDVDTWTVSIVDVNANNEATVTNTRVRIDIKILKIDGKTEKPLTGAGFKLERKNGKKDNDGNDLYDRIEEFTITDETGLYSIKESLRDGQYRLTETVVPTGYIGFNAPIEFKIVNGAVEEHSDTVVYVSADKTFKIGNTPASELPATGGSGTLIYTITGIFLITLAGVLLVARKRKVNR